MAAIFVALSTVMMSVATVSPAMASGPEPVRVLVSHDGTTFGESLTRPVFAIRTGLVPARSLAADLWVKNPSDSSAALAVSITNRRISDAGLASALWMDVEHSVTRGQSKVLDAPGDCLTLASGEELAAGEATRTVMRLGLSDVADLIGQRGTASFDIHVALWDAQGPPPGDLCGTPGAVVPGIDSDKPIVGLPAAGGTGACESADVEGKGLRAAGLAITALSAGVTLAVIVARRRRPLR